MGTDFIQNRYSVCSRLVRSKQVNIRHKNLSDLSATDFSEPAEGWADREDETVDFKLEGPLGYRTLEKGKGRNELKLKQVFELALDASALANTMGGDLVFGVGQTAGAIGVEIPNADSLQRQVQQAIRNGTDPPLRVTVQCVPGFERGSVVVVRVPERRTGLVSARRQNQPERFFYLRQGNENRSMTMREIEEGFRQGSGFLERLENFRRQRVRGAVSDIIGTDESRVVLHIQSLSEGFPGNSYAVEEVEELKPPGNFGSWHSMRMAEGVLVWAGVQDTQQRPVRHSYILGMRARAVVEAVDRMVFESNVRHPKEIVDSFLSTLFFAAPHFFRSLDVKGPFIVQLSLVGFRGVTVPHGFLERSREQPIISDVVHLPALELDRMEGATLKDYHPLFDLLWATFNLPTPPIEKLEEQFGRAVIGFGRELQKLAPGAPR